MTLSANHRLYIVMLATDGSPDLHPILIHASAPQKAMEAAGGLAHAHRPGARPVGVLTQEDVAGLEMLLEGGRAVLAQHQGR